MQRDQLLIEKEAEEFIKKKEAASKDQSIQVSIQTFLCHVFFIVFNYYYGVLWMNGMKKMYHNL